MFLLTQASASSKPASAMAMELFHDCERLTNWLSPLTRRRYVASAPPMTRARIATEIMALPLFWQHLDLECGDTSPLSNGATCRAVPKRGLVRALQMRMLPRFCLFGSIWIFMRLLQLRIAICAVWTLSVLRLLPTTVREHRQSTLMSLIWEAVAVSTNDRSFEPDDG